MSSRSQRHLRYRDGIDVSATTAYSRGEPSMRSQSYQRAAAIARGRTPGPANTVKPAVTGTAQVGQTLTTTNGTWVGNTPSIVRRWYRGNTQIAGATGLTYVVTLADLNYYVFCRVIASDINGPSYMDSNIVGRVIAA